MRRPSGSKGLSAIRPAILGMGRILGLGLSAAAAHPLAVRGHHDNDSENGDDTSLWVLYVASMTLVLLGGAFAGLTIA